MIVAMQLAKPFERRYRGSDIDLLAQVDAALGHPGHIRVDTVHQGDHDGQKGVYHVNLVDEITQWQHVGTVEAISERFLLPVLQALLQAYPFVVRGFHSDNGSE